MTLFLRINKKPYNDILTRRRTTPSFGLQLRNAAPARSEKDDGGNTQAFGRDVTGTGALARRQLHENNGSVVSETRFYMFSFLLCSPFYCKL